MVAQSLGVPRSAGPCASRLSHLWFSVARSCRCHDPASKSRRYYPIHERPSILCLCLSAYKDRCGRSSIVRADSDDSTGLFEDACSNGLPRQEPATGVCGKGLSRNRPPIRAKPIKIPFMLFAPFSLPKIEELLTYCAKRGTQSVLAA